MSTNKGTIGIMNASTRRMIADTVAMIAFSLIVGFFVEIVISGMTLAQSLQSRLTSIPANLITARPYGIYRDWVLKQFRASKEYPIRTFVGDTIAFLTFQIPLYAVILLISGASPGQIVTACGTVVVISAISGRPYGYFLDLVRRIFGAGDRNQI